MGNEKIDGIIFDMDGTILDSFANNYEWFKKICAENGKPFPFDSMVALRTALMSMDLFPDFYEHLGFDWKDEAVQKMIWTKYREFKRNSTIHLIDGMEEVLRQTYKRSRPREGRVRGLRMALLTSNSWDGFRPAWEHYGLGKYFDVVITRDDVRTDAAGNPLEKPHNWPVEKTLQYLGLSTRRVIHVGDTKGDMEASKGLLGRNPDEAVDMVTIGVAWGFDGEARLRDAGADHVVHSPHELLTLFEKMGAFR